MKPLLEAVQLESPSLIRSLYCECSDFQKDHGWHYHPEFEIAFIEAGEGTRFVGDNVDTFHAGELLLLSPNIPHCWVNFDNSLNNKLHVLQFDPDKLGAAFWGLPELSELSYWLNQSSRCLQFGGFQLEGIKYKMQAISSASGVSKVNLFLELLEMLMNCSFQRKLISDIYSLDKDNFHGARMNKVIDYIRQHLGDEIRQVEVAELVGMTSQSFSRFFRASSGRTFVAFVNHLRITEVCRQLESSDDDIADIAFRCGFSNLSNFNRRFSSIKHTTPREYRQSLQKRIIL